MKRSTIALAVTQCAANIRWAAEKQLERAFVDPLPIVENYGGPTTYKQVFTFPAHVRARRTEVQNTPISPPSGDSNDSNP